MKIYNIGKYTQIVKNGDITCTCMWSSLHPDNWKEGKQICRHIRSVVNRGYGIKKSDIRSAYRIREKNIKKVSKKPMRNVS